LRISRSGRRRLAKTHGSFRGIRALAGDTDGVDGIEENAGAYIAPDTLCRAWAEGMKPRDNLANNDGHGFFESLGDSVVTGRRAPTLMTSAPC
jgi:glycerate-2-kinase